MKTACLQAKQSDGDIVQTDKLAMSTDQTYPVRNEPACCYCCCLPFLEHVHELLECATLSSLTLSLSPIIRIVTPSDGLRPPLHFACLLLLRLPCGSSNRFCTELSSLSEKRRARGFEPSLNPSKTACLRAKQSDGDIVQTDELAMSRTNITPYSNEPACCYCCCLPF